MTFDERLAVVRPHKRQIDFQQLEFYAFIRFTVNTFTVEALQDGAFTEVYNGTVIGYKRIVPLNGLKTKAIRIRITDSRTEPTIAFLGIYKGE